MQSVELIGLDEIELRGFLNSLPELWNAKKRFFQAGISTLLSNYVDTEKLLVCTYIFGSSNTLIILLAEFLKEIGAATFKIHAYTAARGFPSLNEWAEMRLCEIIREFSEKDMFSFREKTASATFTCPRCGAHYSFRALRKTKDDLFECQNCGKYVHAEEPEIHTSLESSDENTDSLF
jgi:predicted RNA-binding Zn-ribbon protein involved in translation (DUF1610 family)